MFLEVKKQQHKAFSESKYVKFRPFVHILVIIFFVSAQPTLAALPAVSICVNKLLALVKSEPGKPKKTELPHEIQAWNSLKLESELKTFSQLNQEQKTAYLEKISNEILEKIKAARGIQRLGLHYNLHGGNLREFRESNGLYATIGDVAALNGSGGSFQKRVYFFNSQYHSLYSALSSKHHAYLFSRHRMGNVLVLFDPDHPSILKMRKEGLLVSEDEIFFGFSENIGLYGIPSEAYLVPPTEVFTQTQTRLKLTEKLDWDTETLVHLRYLEQLLTVRP